MKGDHKTICTVQVFTGLFFYGTVLTTSMAKKKQQQFGELHMENMLK